MLISSPQTINQKSCGKGRACASYRASLHPISPLSSLPGSRRWQPSLAGFSVGKQLLEVFVPPALLWTASSYTESPRRLQQGFSVTNTEIYTHPPPLPHPAGVCRLFPGKLTPSPCYRWERKVRGANQRPHGHTTAQARNSVCLCVPVHARRASHVCVVCTLNVEVRGQPHIWFLRY